MHLDDTIVPSGNLLCESNAKGIDNLRNNFVGKVSLIENSAIYNNPKPVSNPLNFGI